MLIYRYSISIIIAMLSLRISIQFFNIVAFSLPLPLSPSVFSFVQFKKLCEISTREFCNLVVDNRFVALKQIAQFDKKAHNWNTI